MTNSEKNHLRELCREGNTIDEIRLQIECSDATIRRYLKIFSRKPEKKYYGSY